MLIIRVPMKEGFDEGTQEFVITETYELQLEHSLFSISKWESKHEKPFLSHDPKSVADTYSYVSAMNLGPEIPANVFESFSPENLKELNTYIDAKMSATWFNDATPGPKNREVITSEVIYYWLVALAIPFETQHWHLNRLLTLVKVCNQKNQPQKKRMSRNDLAARNRELNAQRKQQLGTHG